MKKTLLIIGTLAFCVAGCSTYEQSSSSLYETRSRAMVTLVEQLLSDPGFTDMYEQAKEIARARNHKIPTISIERIEDNTRAGSNDRSSTGQIYRELQIALRRTGKFRIVDYSLVKGRGDNDIKEIDIGIEDANIANFGNYKAADLMMKCSISKEGNHGFFLDAQIVGPDGTIAADGSVRFK